jgi:translation initiation factor 1
MTTTDPRIRNPLDDILRELDAHEATKVTVNVESRRYGKAVTVIEGLEARSDAPDLLKALKQRLATGGAVKEGRIELQGDHQRRSVEILATYGIEATA